MKKHTPRIEALEARIAPATFTVTSLLDSGSGSLRAAVEAANAAPGADTINVTASGVVKLNSEISITDDLLINGAKKITLDGQNKTRIFSIGEYGDRTLDVTLDGITFKSGKASYGGAISIANSGTVFIRNSTFTNNLAQFDPDLTESGEGGAIKCTGGILKLAASSFTGNIAQGQGLWSRGAGGAIFASNNIAPLDIDGCTFTSNSASGFANASGGAIAVTDSAFPYEESPVRVGLLKVNNSTFTGNIAEIRTDQQQTGDPDAQGGAIYIWGSETEVDPARWNVQVSKSTFSQNIARSRDTYCYVASSGGAIHASGQLRFLVETSAFTANQASGRSARGGAFTGEIGDESGASLVAFTSCTFTANLAESDRPDGPASGGAMWLDGSYQPGASSFSVADSTFSKNTARSLFAGSAQGGAVAFRAQGPLVLRGGSFSGNQATAVFAYGGALDIVGFATVDAKNTVFSGNQAIGQIARGGAVSEFSYSENGSTFESVTFSRNLAKGTDAVAGGAGTSGVIGMNGAIGENGADGGVGVGGNGGGGFIRPLVVSAIYSSETVANIDATTAVSSLVEGLNPAESNGLETLSPSDTFTFAEVRTLAGISAEESGHLKCTLRFGTRDFTYEFDEAGESEISSLTRLIVSGQAGSALGGAIFHYSGTMTIKTSTLVGNIAEGGRGGDGGAGGAGGVGGKEGVAGMSGTAKLPAGLRGSGGDGGNGGEGSAGGNASGGACASEGGTLTIQASTVSGNFAKGGMGGKGGAGGLGGAGLANGLNGGVGAYGGWGTATGGGISAAGEYALAGGGAATLNVTDRSVISNNQALGGDVFGGGIGGGLYGTHIISIVNSTVAGNVAKAANGRDGATGRNGQNGIAGASGVPGADGGMGMAGDDGFAGDNGMNGYSAYGGGIYANGNLLVDRSMVSNNQIISGNGGNGGNGGTGGVGGAGGAAGIKDASGFAGLAGTKGISGSGGDGGNGGQAGAAKGAGIYSRGNTELFIVGDGNPVSPSNNIVNSTIMGNTAKAGAPGKAGLGGKAGAGATDGIVAGIDGVRGAKTIALGGGVFMKASLLVQSTVVNNSVSGNGGGVAGWGLVESSTIFRNRASVYGGGFFAAENEGYFGQFGVEPFINLVKNSLIAANAGGINSAGRNTADVAGAEMDIDHSLLQTCGVSLTRISRFGGMSQVVVTASLIGVDPKLGPLTSVAGALTKILVPRTGSPAINAGSDFTGRDIASLYTSAPGSEEGQVIKTYNDQRGPGFLRLKGGKLDIGSVEVA